jgi:hypothetical protein
VWDAHATATTVTHETLATWQLGSAVNSLSSGLEALLSKLGTGHISRFKVLAG